MIKCVVANEQQVFISQTEWVIFRGSISDAVFQHEAYEKI